MSPISSALTVPPFTPEPWVRGRLPNMSLSLTTPHHHRLQEMELATLTLGPVEPRRTRSRLSFHVIAHGQDPNSPASSIRGRPTRPRLHHGCR